MAPLLVDSSDENVMVLKLFLVASKELLVELECSAPLSVNLEISHGFSGITELLSILDLNDTRVEWSGKVSSDLWLSVKGNLSLALESMGNLG